MMATTGIPLSSFCHKRLLYFDGAKYDSYALKADQVERRVFSTTMFFSDTLFSLIVLNHLSRIENPSDTLDFDRKFILERLTFFRKGLYDSLQKGVSFSQVDPKDIKQIYELPKEHWQGCLNRAFAILSAVFNDTFRPFSLPAEVYKKQNNKTWVLQDPEVLCQPWLELIYTQLGCKQKGNPLVFSKEAYHKFQVHFGVERTKPAKEMRCVEFVLFSIGEQRAKEPIFYSDCYDVSDCLSKLCQWGYKGVLQPQENDLVFYFCEGKANHVGLYTQSGKVHSKLGSDPYCREHDIFDVPLHYGREVVFLRKPSV